MSITYPHRRNLSACGEFVRAGGRWWGPWTHLSWIQVLWALQWSLISWPWGFCTTRSLLAACRRRVGPSCSAIPPSGGAEAASDADVTPKPQTTSADSVENGLFGARWSAFWAQRCLAWRARSYANPLLRVLTRSIARKPAKWSVGGAAQARIIGLTCA